MAGHVRVRDVECDGGRIRVLTLDNPPVNVLSFAFSADLLRAVEEAEAEPAVRTIVFTGANGLFSAGADVNDFETVPTSQTKTVRDVIAAVERGEKIYIAGIAGVAMGGAFELALACDYRLASRDAKVGLPEIKLGLLPGAGGTQRLTRLVGARAALEMMLKGESVKAPAALERGLIDEIVEGNIVESAVAFASQTKLEKRRISARKPTIAKTIPNAALPYVVAQAHQMVPPEDNGGYAAHKLIDAVEASVELPFLRGLAREERLFEELARSAPSAALRHIFFAERELSKVPGLDSAQAREIAQAGVIGAGTMGTGIAITFAQAGIPVIVIETAGAAIDKARQMVFGMFAHQVQKGRLTQEQAWKMGQSIRFTADYGELASADVVIEAVYENMDVKKTVFAKLDAVVKPEAILATNTSTLDIDEMASVVSRPERFVGLHFFAPANIMKLLEIVRGAKTSPETLATAFVLGKKLRKVAVLSGNAFGFIGNRMLFDYAREAVGLAEEGVPPQRVDAAMKRFGFAMGPFAMFDLSGVDVMWHIAKARPDMSAFRTAIVDRLVEMKRLGQKTGRGFYAYDKAAGKGREPIPDPDIVELFAREAAQAGIAQHPDIDDAQIVERLTRALTDRGAHLLDERVAQRPGDIDIVYVYGYGYPPHRGGPMWTKELAHA
ncbi:MAG: 3-hydroxyacyl-CoA dehydrogenase NAD-binding domain-containing protein [Candidatus Eremiobacteraeota bacterium]|nr:3-hydroxyacyl-CoA dehydrogenase NAD-binding domain-containing protein [Candidatus Eremiobacteraeota bacterium]